jgi:hypothetical protein
LSQYFRLDIRRYPGKIHPTFHHFKQLFDFVGRKFSSVEFSDEVDNKSAQVSARQYLSLTP